jgi:exosortase E/protease (VPEID-CTERM system)
MHLTESLGPAHAPAARAHSEGAGDSPRLPVGRWLFLAALLLAEVLGLTLRFDSGSLLGLRTWWADLAGSAHHLPQLGIAVAAALCAFGGTRLRDELHRVSGQTPPWPAWPFFLAHLAALACFTSLSFVVLDGGVRSSAYPGAWVMAWAATAFLTLAFWAATAVSVSLWLPFVRRAFVPLLTGVLVGGCAWGAGQLTGWLWRPLSAWTFATVRGLLSLLSPEVVSRPADLVVGTPTFSVEIAPACSGYEGIGLILVFLGVYLWLYRADLRFPAALLLLPLAAVIIWLANSVRITALLALGTWVSKDVALGGFHSQAGWLAFNAVALGTIVLVQRSRFFSRRPVEAGARNETAPYLVPLMVLVATLMVTGALAAGFDWLYPVRVVTAGLVLWYFWPRYAELRWSWSWSAVGIGVAVFVLWVALEPAAPPGAADAFSAGLAGLGPWGAAAWLLFRVAGSVVVIPLVEELAFRGYLTRRLIAADFRDVPVGEFRWFSFLVSSALFGALHGRWVAGVLAGMLYALAAWRRRELSDAVVAHGTTNALLAAYVLATGAWPMWC